MSHLLKRFTPEIQHFLKKQSLRRHLTLKRPTTSLATILHLMEYSLQAHIFKPNKEYYLSLIKTTKMI